MPAAEIEGIVSQVMEPYGAQPVGGLQRHDLKIFRGIERGFLSRGGQD